MNIRIGHGYDVHKLVEQRKLIIEGVDIPHALSNNFAFGGSNVCAILSRCD